MFGRNKKLSKPEAKAPKSCGSVVSFEEVNQANVEYMTLAERRRKLLQILKDCEGLEHNKAIGLPLKWLTNDSRIAAQSLVDSRLATYSKVSSSRVGEVLQLTRRGSRRSADLVS